MMCLSCNFETMPSGFCIHCEKYSPYKGLPFARLNRMISRDAELQEDINRLMSQRADLATRKSLSFLTLLCLEFGGSEGEATDYGDLEEAFYKEVDAPFSLAIEQALQAGEIAYYSVSKAPEDAAFIVTRKVFRMLGE